MIDDKLTKEIQTFLDIDPKTDDDIIAGAGILLRINRNKALHQNICRKPQKLLSKLTYELQKHLRYRLDGLTLAEVRKQEAEVLPVVAEAIAEGCPVTDDEETDAESTEPHRGRRADHDSLPDEIKALWTKNAERWKRMKEAFATCQELEMACDRYEYVKMLSETYKKYREDMNTYDSYVAGGDKDKAKAPSADKAVSLARSYISKNKAKYDELVASGDTDAASALKEKLQQRVDTLVANNAAMGDDLQQWLTANAFNMEA